MLGWLTDSKILSILGQDFPNSKNYILIGHQNYLHRIHSSQKLATIMDSRAETRAEGKRRRASGRKSQRTCVKLTF